MVRDRSDVDTERVNIHHMCRLFSVWPIMISKNVAHYERAGGDHGLFDTVPRRLPRNDPWCVMVRFLRVILAHAIALATACRATCSPVNGSLPFDGRGGVSHARRIFSPVRHSMLSRVSNPEDRA